MNFNRAVNASPDDFEDEDLPPEAFETPAASPESQAEAAPEADKEEQDEFDLALEALPEDDGSASLQDAPAAPEADSVGDDLRREEEGPSAREREIMEDMRENGSSQEQAAANAAARKAEGRKDEDERRQEQGQRGPRPGAGATVAGVLGGAVGGLFKGLANGGKAAIRKTGISPAMGLNPEVIKKKLEYNWHNEYERGVRGMETSLADVTKAAAAFNQLIKTSAPGRELEKIAKQRGTDLKSLLADISDGKVDDVGAKSAAEALRTNPNISAAFDRFKAGTEAYGESLHRVRENMEALAANGSSRIDPALETNRLNGIHKNCGKVEEIFQLPGGPAASPEAAPGTPGKSPQKKIWEQFQDFAQNGLNFLQNLFQKVADFVSSKFGK